MNCVPITEIFPNPTVKQVIFEIRYPNLFFLENKIGDLQQKIMGEFPKSALLFRRQIVLADVGPQGKLEEISGKFDEMGSKKIWQFQSNKGYKLNISTNSLDITSEYHKTYNLGSGDRFREVIKNALDNFFELTMIPTVTRIGLRYVDECPIPNKTNRTFKRYYKSVFPIERFNLAQSEEMFFRTVTTKDNLGLIYMETLAKVQDKYKLVLDFDGFATNVSSPECLATTDKLHDLIVKEYENTIKEPVYEYMRQRRD